ncbi:type I-F CRISPR-associated protein Csy2 [Litoribrevibacter albus]|uniref:Type I-F CRISPR-associated protein Csy2 n=1 Tax=Litoribrevibacter albus TaxID=1473156 RepID=A0AA37W7C2_9GAMM|nr:type I-F CRISPR-associated protein Csy2 [Litoribrevibacter albus]GLQ32440.1 type I-F CRISPR-associated protein Csy2 [Litoribrevibacter albus]
MDGFIALRNLQVENANAIAGQTWGFPAITHFLGFMHSLERKLSERSVLEIPLRLSGCAVICHDLSPQTAQAAAYSEHVFSLTRNPLTKEAKTPSFVEEGRAHMTVSLIIGIDELPPMDESEFKALEQAIKNIVLTQRLAGGTIKQLAASRVVSLHEKQEKRQEQVNLWLRTFLPGYVLVARTDLLVDQQHHFSGDSDPAFSTWLGNSKLHFDGEGQPLQRPYKGWIKPIPVGYKAISPLYQAGSVARSRDEETPVRFVEYVYTLGEWLSPHRINDLTELLWYYSTAPEEGWYLCQNDYKSPNSNLTEIA